MKTIKSKIRRLIREQMALENIVSDVLISEPDDLQGGRDLGYGEGEGRMTKSQLDKLARYSQSLHDKLMDDDDLPEWVQSSIAVAADNVGKVYHYLEYKLKNMDQNINS